MQRLKALCRRICVLLWGEVKASSRAIKSYWWLFLSLVAAILSWVGWMHERTDKIAHIEAMHAELRENRETLQTLLDTQRLGPRHTACDTKQILADLRARGVALPPYEVEGSCR